MAKQREGFLPEEPQEEPRHEEDDRVIDMVTGVPVEGPPPDVWPVKVKLMHKAIRGPKGDDLHELSFREPTGADINRYGCPVRVNQEGDIVIDERKMSMMMGALSGVVMPLLERMDPRDWQSCAYRLRGFFLPNPAAW